MLEEHHIAWIYLQTDDGGMRKCLPVGGKPEAVFALGGAKVVAGGERWGERGFFYRPTVLSGVESVLQNAGMDLLLMSVSTPDGQHRLPPAPRWTPCRSPTSSALRTVTT